MTRVIVLEHLGDLSARVIFADPAHERFCSSVLLAEVLHEGDARGLPYLAEFEGEYLTPLTMSVTPVNAIVPKGPADVLRVTGQDVEQVVPLDRIRPGLFRRVAKLALEEKVTFLVGEGPSAVLVWDFIDRSLNDVLEEAGPDLVELARSSARSPNVFVNPYTFVPFPASEPVGFKAAPAGHGRLAPDRYSGRIDLRFTAATPMLTRGATAGQFPRDAEGRPIVPGSSIKGAIRSVHEVMAGGCLRVVDLDFVPVYRDQPKPLGESWRLAVVGDVASDGPVDFVLCDKVAWTPADLLHTVVPPAKLASGTRVTITGTTPDSHGRTVGTSVTAGDDWVVHITAAEARGKHPYHAACGRISAVRAPVVSAEVYARYRRVVDGARDLQTTTPTLEVKHPGRDSSRVIGTRRRASIDLHTDDVVWVNVERGEVVEIKLSYLWRTEGVGALKERVPHWCRPCDGELLCPTCRIFGSAEETPTDRGEWAEQHSYRGHLRFADATLIEGVPATTELPPMGAPHLGVGAFVLRMDPGHVAAKHGVPTGRWGASPDNRQPREVRGRKFYWNADPTLQQPRRDRKGPEQKSEEMGGPAEVLPAASVLSTSIHFVNLSRAELGGLLAVLQPDSALGPFVPPGYVGTEQPLQLRFGGGKPLGFGAVDTTIDDIVIETAAARYLGQAAAEAPSRGDLIAAFVESAPPEIIATWPDLAAVLRHGHVNPGRVAYPPGRPWPSGNEPTYFRSPFEFFKRTSGSADCKRPLQVLASSPREMNQHLRIVEEPKRDEKEGGTGDR